MKIVQINSTYNIGSTGKIMKDLNDVIVASGNESFMLCAYSKESCQNLYVMKSFFKYPINDYINTMFPRITGLNGYGHKKSTKLAIQWLDSIKPDVIHLHNIHGDWINIRMLFDYIQTNKVKLVWTLHDCWAFTGRCSHFELFGCNRWKEECGHCQNKRVYPFVYFFDFSKKMLLDKKKWYGDLSNITLVTPSNWLKKYVEMSFLNKNKIVTIHNGIDTSIYRKTEDNYFSFLGNKKILLGVSNSWSKTKGLNDFIKLDSIIDHSTYQIVLIGLNKRQIRKIPKSIYGMRRTTDQQELAKCYSSAHAFINPTYQDNYPTTNLEAQSCLTRCYTYNTGGCPESVDSAHVFEKGDIEGIYKSIVRNENVQHIVVEFDKQKLFCEYLKIYLTI